MSEKPAASLLVFINEEFPQVGELRHSQIQANFTWCLKQRSANFFCKGLDSK
jgi:hypothetical protein